MPDAVGRLIRLPFHGFEHRALEDAGISRAGRLVVALSDDDATVDLALAAQRRYSGLPVLARLSDGWLTRNLYHLPGGKNLSAFTEFEASAREIVMRHPLFMLCEDREQRRIHVLLLGDDEWIEALLTEILLSSRTLKFGKPKFTLATTDANAVLRRFAARYPELRA